MTEPALTRFAPAKVNLTLEVLRRRPDGYHDICTVMQRLTLADRLDLSPAPHLSVECDRPELEGPENLVWRAAELLQRCTGTRRGAALRLTKRIPIAAGLGGGSADAAAALEGLVALWDIDLSRERLVDLAAELGSDVPFFLHPSPSALAEGRGECLSALPPLARRWLVLVKPEVGISAAAVYKAFPPERWSDGRRTRAWLDQAWQQSTVPPPFNDLEAVALQVEPRAASARSALLAAGAPGALMSGSGSTYFALFTNADEARLVSRRLRDMGWSGVYVSRFAQK
jgi:4-diphosphocytidyl-2-C-methyl-D-erythritol kinase